MKKNKQLYKITLTAIFAALAFAGTFIQIPLPTGGMVHLGNFVVIISALLCGGLVGGISGGIGCGLYDLLIYSSWDGFIKYLVLKFIMGMIVGYTFRILFKKKDSFNTTLWLAISGVVILLLTTLVIILYNTGHIKISYQHPQAYIAIVATLAYLVGILIIAASIFGMKLKKIHKFVLISISLSIVVNIILEFITKIILSLTLDSLNFQASLIKGFSTMPSCILTGALSLILGTLIYPPLYKATKNINYFNDLDINEEELV
mgnify:CR=1 FL=1